MREKYVIGLNSLDRSIFERPIGRIVRKWSINWPNCGKAHNSPKPRLPSDSEQLIINNRNGTSERCCVEIIPFLSFLSLSLSHLPRTGIIMLFININCLTHLHNSSEDVLLPSPAMASVLARCQVKKLCADCTLAGQRQAGRNCRFASTGHRLLPPKHKWHHQMAKLLAKLQFRSAACSVRK